MDQEEKRSRHGCCVWLFNREKFAFQTRTRAPVTNRPHFDTHHRPQRHANKSFLVVLLPSHGYANLGCRAAWQPDCRIIHPIEFLTVRREFINEMYTCCTSSSLPRQQSGWFDATWKWRFEEGRVSSVRDWDQLVSE